MLIVDEPTSSLGGDDVARLFETLAALRERGLGILYISHFLDEVRRIADAFTVLSDGRVVASGEVKTKSNDELVVAMAGHGVEAVERGARREPGEVVLSLDELGGERLPVRVTLELHRGEVLGVAGLVGSGRTELLRAIFGLDKVKRGKLRVLLLDGPRSARERLAQGVGMVSEDRAREGLALDLSIAQNLVLSRLGALTRHGLLSLARERDAARRVMRELDIKAADGAVRVGDLSGGNQQKVALGRLLFHDVNVLLLDEPTRGINVRSRTEIHRLIGELAARGKAVLMVSSHLEELLSVCDRVTVMRRGVLGAARSTEGLSERELLGEAAGA